MYIYMILYDCVLAFFIALMFIDFDRKRSGQSINAYIVLHRNANVLNYFCRLSIPLRYLRRYLNSYCLPISTVEPGPILQPQNVMQVMLNRKRPEKLVSTCTGQRSSGGEIWTPRTPPKTNLEILEAENWHPWNVKARFLDQVDDQNGINTL